MRTEDENTANEHANEDKDDDYNAQCYAMLCYQQNPEFRKFVRKLSNCRTIASLDVDGGGGKATNIIKEDIQRKSSFKALKEGTRRQKQLDSSVVSNSESVTYPSTTIESTEVINRIIEISKQRK